MNSSEQTVLSSAISGMSAVMMTKWHRLADCSTHEPQLPETRGHQQLTGTSQARRVCSLMPSEDAAERRGPPHAGGCWRGMTELGIISWTPFSERILLARIRHAAGHISVIVAYAPTECTDRQSREEFYMQLERLVGWGLTAPSAQIGHIVPYAAGKGRHIMW